MQPVILLNARLGRSLLNIHVIELSDYKEALRDLYLFSYKGYHSSTYN